ncbi:MAG: enoyl-CoA hydratase/isomerase family protein [Acidimicrobiia bacterium]|nr:enoyl-CoA hydratase/isomerase family protein [Acidimicrobiia bacterium]
MEVAKGVATVVLANPRRKNAINEVMWGELTAAFHWVASDATVRVLVVTGEGDEFCSGADLARSPDGHWLAYMRYVNGACLALAAVPQPSIARVDGVAVGAGMNLALGCDLVVASDRARFSEIFARRGLSLDFGGSWLLPRRVGLHKAKELALLAPIIDAAEADRIGLVNRVVPAAELDAAVGEWARQLAAGPPVALAQTKALLDRSSTSSLADSLEAEAAAQTVNFATSDTAEAIAAFLAKREPKYSGR